MTDDVSQRPKSRKLWFAAALLIVVAVSAFHPGASVTYRLTLRTEVAGQQTSGSGLVNVAFFNVPRFLGSTAVMEQGVSGEAVSVGLGDRGLLVALLGAGEDPRSAPEYVVPVAFGLSAGGVDASHLPKVNALSGTRNLPAYLVPAMVYFSNPSDPSSARFLSAKDLAKPFAPEVNFLGADVEIIKSTWLHSWKSIR